MFTKIYIKKSLLSLGIMLVLLFCFLVISPNEVYGWYDLPKVEKYCPDGYRKSPSGGFCGPLKNRCCMKVGELRSRITSGDVNTNLADLGISCDQQNYDTFVWDRLFFDSCGGIIVSCNYKVPALDLSGTEVTVNCSSSKEGGSTCQDVGSPRVVYCKKETWECDSSKGECSSRKKKGGIGCITNCAQAENFTVHAGQWCLKGTFHQNKPTSCGSSGDNGSDPVGTQPVGEPPIELTCADGGDPPGKCTGEGQDCVKCCEAEGVWTELGCIKADQYGVTVAVMRIFVGIVTGIAVLRFIQAGLMLNSDDPEKIKEGKGIAISAVMAMIFGAMIPILLNFIGVDILGIGELF